MDNPFKPLFPSPLEVDRFISEREKGEHTMSKFPSPLEVDRFISKTLSMHQSTTLMVSVPSRGR